MSITIDGHTYRIYRVTIDDLERHETLEYNDIGRYYIIVQGAMMFIDPSDYA